MPPPGRISVIKNLLIPLLNYLGCILTPSDAVLDGIQESLDNFAISGNQVSKDRRYLKPADGGLGLFELKSFLTAQKVPGSKGQKKNNRQLAL
jgi:hypothetical protein